MATPKRPDRPDTSPLVEIFADWEGRIKAALLGHWQRKGQDLIARLEAIKAVGDINKDKEWWSGWTAAYLPVILPYIEEAGIIGADSGANILDAIWSLGVDSDLYLPEVSEWARKHAGKLVKGLTRTDRTRLRRQLSAWVESSEDFPALVQRVDSIINNPARAENIATTEATEAYAEGNLTAWRESGVVSGKIWNTARDELVCPICQPLDGQIVELDADFVLPDFDFERHAMPAHPRCRCWLSPWVGEVDA